MAETVAEYKARVLSYVHGRDGRASVSDLLKLLAASPKRIARAAGAATPRRLKRRPAPGKWSVAEILAHLADTEVAMGWRLRMIASFPGAPLQGFDQDQWASRLDYAACPPRASLDAYLAARTASLAMLKRLRPAQWKHEGNHSERGPESLVVVATMLAGHDLNHLRQIEAILL